MRLMILSVTAKSRLRNFIKHDNIIRVYGRLIRDIPKIPNESIQKAFNECISLIDHIKDKNHKDFVTLIHAIYFNELKYVILMNTI